MNIDNDYIADQFSLLAKLMDIHGENSFKIKSYSIAAFTIEKLPEQLSAMPSAKIASIKGIGDAISKKIADILQTGNLPLLQDYLQRTPPGILEMLRIKGIGPKKIATIWKEMEIESIGELLYACNENRLLLFKGFGEKTQKNIQETITYYLKHQGSYLYAETEAYAQAMHQKLLLAFPSSKFAITGECRRQMEIINQLDWITTVQPEQLQHYFESNGFATTYHEHPRMMFNGPENVKLCFHVAEEQDFYSQLFQTSCSETFLTEWNNQFGEQHSPTISEEEIFERNSIHFIPAFQRETAAIISKAKQTPLAQPIQAKDLRGIIHSHSNWSDGANTIEEMAKACIDRGLEYLVISDHSKSAFYANGLQEDRIKEQHAYIEELNNKLAPFYIFKSIECDILNDGSLDYNDSILSTFDLVIASVHSNLKMTEEKAMIRLIKAIENPFTTILGHMTGRLLLSRPGYPVAHDQIIEACAKHNVIIELNAHPRRLDIDWRHIESALEKNVLISIDPDAHSINGFSDIYYGVLAAQKAGVTAKQNFSSFSLAEVKEYITNRKKK